MKTPSRRSISPETLTLADNSWRLKKFQTRTILTEKSGKKVVHKLATTEEAKAFLKTIAAREQTNIEYLKRYFNVLCGNIKRNCIEYEYLPYQSLTQKIRFELGENRCDRADELLEIYVRKVRKLDRLYTCPREFLSMISKGVDENLDLEVDCLSRGVLDLTPRNILVDGRRWIVVDNEWSFDFPVPVVFVLFRAIVEMVIELQDEIRRSTTKERPAVGILGRALRIYYFPEHWIKHIMHSHVSFAQMLRWELGFRQYITGSSGGTVGHVKTRPRTKAHFSFRCASSSIMSIGRGVEFVKKLPGTQQFVHFFERMLLRFKR